MGIKKIDSNLFFVIVPVLVFVTVLSVWGKKYTVRAAETTITISAAGDCTFGSDAASPSSVNFYSVYKKVKNPAYFFRKVKKFFSADDLSIVNFEGTLTKRTTRASKKYAFKGNPSYVNILKKASIEAVAFANNHCRDYGQGSYSDTIRVFEKKDIAYSSYSKVSIYKTKGKRIGMISVNGLEGLSSCKNYIDSGMKKLKKKKADLVIVSMHAGIEYSKSVSSEQRELAYYAVRQGANLVLGHHPHILQGIEKYKGVYIVYSMGNFCFGGNTNPSDKDTMIFQQTFSFQGNKLKKKLEAKIIPCRLSSSTTINNYQPMSVTGKGKKRIIAKMNRYSNAMGVKVSADGILK
jgi:poly-gamma-glutamate synthesis protein (capsule biosynthesis protein)